MSKPEYSPTKKYLIVATSAVLIVAMYGVQFSNGAQQEMTGDKTDSIVDGHSIVKRSAPVCSVGGIVQCCCSAPCGYTCKKKTCPTGTTKGATCKTCVDYNTKACYTCVMNYVCTVPCVKPPTCAKECFDCSVGTAAECCCPGCGYKCSTETCPADTPAGVTCKKCVNPETRACYNCNTAYKCIYACINPSSCTTK